VEKLGKYRLTLIVIGIAVVIGASLPPFMTASCLTHQQTPAELRALEGLRAMTRGGVLPAEDVVARIESDYPRSKAAALARIVRARIRLNAKDFAGAASLLDANVIRDHSSIGDYALLMRGGALEQAGKLPEARAAYEELLAAYPGSTLAREATLRVANILMRGGFAVASQLKDLVAKDDPAALLLAARASEQTADSTGGLSDYRHLYFYAPATAESAEAATAITRLGSSLSPANADEAMARAEKLYAAKRFLDATQAYGDAFTRFPDTSTPAAQLHRVIAATGVKKTADAISALNAIPSSAGETRAEALYYLAQAYARAKQWDQARTTVEELRRSFAASPFTPRALVSVGQIAEDANNDADASYFLRTAVTGIKGRVKLRRRSLTSPG
jgi:TolA-binding protein